MTETQLLSKYQLVPAVPTGLYLQPQGGQFTLNWQSVAGATNYYVKRSTTLNGTYSIIATNATTSFTDTTASSTNIYYYVVSAFNAAGASANSAAVGTQALLSSHDAIGPSARTTPIAFSEIMWKPAPRADGKNLEFSSSIIPIRGFRTSAVIRSPART